MRLNEAFAGVIDPLAPQLKRKHNCKYMCVLSAVCVSAFYILFM